MSRSCCLHSSPLPPWKWRWKFIMWRWTFIFRWWTFIYFWWKFPSVLVLPFIRNRWKFIIWRWKFISTWWIFIPTSKVEVEMSVGIFQHLHCTTKLRHCQQVQWSSKWELDIWPILLKNEPQLSFSEYA